MPLSNAERQARKRGRWADSRGNRRNAAAIEATIAELRRAGRLEAADAALIAAARTTADALDRADSPYAAVIVSRAHLEAVARLLDRPITAPDALDLWVASLRRPTPEV